MQESKRMRMEGLKKGEQRREGISGRREGLEDERKDGRRRNRTEKEEQIQGKESKMDLKTEGE